MSEGGWDVWAPRLPAAAWLLRPAGSAHTRPARREAAACLLLMLPLNAGSAHNRPACESSPDDHGGKGHANNRDGQRAVAAIGVTDVAKDEGAEGADDEACGKGIHGGLSGTRACLYSINGPHL